jgi:hypothetical protein
MGDAMAKTLSEAASNRAVQAEIDPEFDAMQMAYSALRALDTDARRRVIEYVMRRFSIGSLSVGEDSRPDSSLTRQETVTNQISRSAEPDHAEEEGVEGISPIAQKWMRRNGLEATNLSKLFSLGVDEIDLVAKSVPGKGKKERMHNVLLLQCVAAYLSSGAPRVADDKLREACLHYDAYDSPNFSKYLRSLAAEVSGSKEAGYSLTARGLTAATELVKSLGTSK